jgi:hypothetical protein
MFQSILSQEMEIEMAIGAPERTVFSRSLHEIATINRYWCQNAADLEEQAKRSESAGTRCSAELSFE